MLLQYYSDDTPILLRYYSDTNNNNLAAIYPHPVKPE